MGFKCAMQIKGLTRGEPAPNKKHRMNLRKATMEAGYERASKSETLDKRRSHFNRYDGFVKGSECADVMETESEFTTVRKKDGTIVQRKTKSDLVPGFAVVCNPPYEVCKSWDDATYAKFYRDSWECLCSCKPKIFRDENLVMTAEHFDEGVPPEDITDIRQIDRHKHFIGYAQDEKGGWCGNEIDAKFFVELNKVFPQMMRDRGWDMDELDTTDFERAKDDPEYRAERDYKRGQSGRDVNQYIRRKAEKTLDEAEALRDEAEVMRDEAVAIGNEAETAIAERDEAIAERDQAYGEAAQKIDEAIRAEEIASNHIKLRQQEAQKNLDAYRKLQEEALKKRDDLNVESEATKKEIESLRQVAVQKVQKIIQEADEIDDLKKQLSNPLNYVRRFMDKFQPNKDGKTLWERFQEWYEKERAKDEATKKSREAKFAEIAEQAGMIEGHHTKEFEGME